MSEYTDEQIRNLIDKEAIREMMNEWFYLVDDSNAVEALDRFTTEDVTFDGGSLGKADSKEEWIEMTKVIFKEELLFTRHLVSNEIIRIEGDKATGRWYLNCPTINGNDEALWIHGTYHIDFRKVNGEWKVSSFNFDPTYVTPYDKGWAEQPFPEGMPGELEW